MAQTLEQTKFNPKTATWYKILQGDKSCSGGDFQWSLPTLNENETWISGDWHTHEGELKICKSGFHLTNNPIIWREENCTVFTCEVEKNSFGEYDEDDNKIVVSKVRLTAVLNGKIVANGIKYYFKDGQLHRDNDLPAIECATGSKSWWKEGKKHRDNDRPAIEHSDREKYWYKEGKLHRDDDKPAVEYADGTKLWYKNGEQYYPESK